MINEQRWNNVILVSCVVALFLDPLFFFIPAVGGEDDCIKIERPLALVVTVLRTITDTFYLFHMALHFRSALGTAFWSELIAILPIPQVVLWAIVLRSKGPIVYQAKKTLRLIVFLQYIPRIYLIFPIISKIVKSKGLVTKRGWAGAAYNLVVYILASHFIGATWYLLAIERKDTCWRQQCKMEKFFCKYDYLYCGVAHKNNQREIWRNNTSVFQNCHTSPSFGIYQEAFEKNIVSAKFMNKYSFCLCYGLRQLSSLGQNLSTSTFIGEIVFATLISISGIVLFALLVGNIQTYLARLQEWSEWRVREDAIEKWIQRRKIPPTLCEDVRRYNHFKWVATRGVDEEDLLQSLPPNLRRRIKLHLCLDLVLQVPVFRGMDKRVLDAICERLKPVLCTKDTIIVREGDNVNEMMFIIRGMLDSQTSNGFTQIKLGAGHFCGEELLTWVLNPKPPIDLPTSTRTVSAVGEVEAFTLTAEDLKFVVKKFLRLLDRNTIRHIFRCHSHQWRTWAACFIQAAWRRYKKSRRSHDMQVEERSLHLMDDHTSHAQDSNIPISLGATIFASRFAQNAMHAVHRLRKLKSNATQCELLKLTKPKDQDPAEEDHVDQL